MKTYILVNLDNLQERSPTSSSSDLSGMVSTRNSELVFENDSLLEASSVNQLN